MKWVDIPQEEFINPEIKQLQELYKSRPSKKLEERIKRVYLRDLNERIKGK